MAEKKSNSPPDPAARAAATTSDPAAAVAPAPVTAGPVAPRAAATESEPEKLGRGERRAATRVKYDGTWYAPGDAVPFKSAKDAEPYDASGALEPK